MVGEDNPWAPDVPRIQLCRRHGTRPDVPTHDWQIVLCLEHGYVVRVGEDDFVRLTRQEIPTRNRLSPVRRIQRLCCFGKEVEEENGAEPAAESRMCQHVEKVKCSRPVLGDRKKDVKAACRRHADDKYHAWLTEVAENICPDQWSAECSPDRQKCREFITRCHCRLTGISMSCQRKWEDPKHLVLPLLNILPTCKGEARGKPANQPRQVPPSRVEMLV